MKTPLLLIATVFLWTLQGCASSPESKTGGKQPTFKWVGTVTDEDQSHTTDHFHNLDFVRKSDKKKFTIVDSPELVEVHHSAEKDLLVEIEARKTSKFLFWGGNLKVINFKVLEEKADRPHGEPLERLPPSRGSIRF